MKLTNDLMDRAIRANLPDLLQSFEIAQDLRMPIEAKAALIEGGILEFLASYEAALSQPIDTGPKDGTPIHVYEPRRTLPYAVGWWKGAWRHASDFDGKVLFDDMSEYEPAEGAVWRKICPAAS